MTVTLELDQLVSLMHTSAEAGARRALQMAGCGASDDVKQREARRMLRARGKRGSDLERMEAEGLIHGRRRGAARNSPVIYSRAEIEEALQCIETYGKLF